MYTIKLELLYGTSHNGQYIAVQQIINLPIWLYSPVHMNIEMAAIFLDQDVIATE